MAECIAYPHTRMANIHICIYIFMHIFPHEFILNDIWVGAEKRIKGGMKGDLGFRQVLKGCSELMMIYWKDNVHCGFVA